MALDRVDIIGGHLLPEVAPQRSRTHRPTLSLQLGGVSDRRADIRVYRPHFTQWVLSKTMHRVMGRESPLHDQGKHNFLPLIDVKHNPYGANVDNTRAAEAAFSRRIPKLRRGLDTDTQTQKHSLRTLADVLRDPERVSEALRQHVPQRLLELMLHRDTVVRERCLAVVAILAESGIGRDALMALPDLFYKIKVLIFDEFSSVRLRAAEALRMLVSFRMGPYDVDEEDLAPFLVYVVHWEKEPCIVVIHLFSLKLLMKLDSTKEKCIAAGAWDTLESLINSPNSKVASEAMAVATELVMAGKTSEIHKGLIHNHGLRKHLSSSDPHMAESAARLLIPLTLTTDGKKMAFEKKLDAKIYKQVLRDDMSFNNEGVQQALKLLGELPESCQRLESLRKELSEAKQFSEHVP